MQDKGSWISWWIVKLNFDQKQIEKQKNKTSNEHKEKIKSVLTSCRNIDNILKDLDNSNKRHFT